MSAGNSWKHFNPLPPHGGRLQYDFPALCINCISIHSLRMEGDEDSAEIMAEHDISIHSLRMEGDKNLLQKHSWVLYFNPLPPHGGRQRVRHVQGRDRCISIHSLRMEGDCYVHKLHKNAFISIHSLRMEGDLEQRKKAIKKFNISIHSLRMEGDGATPIGFSRLLFISIHSLRMEGDLDFYRFTSGFHISIHSLRMEGDFLYLFYERSVNSFQSTPSAWRETQQCHFIVSIIGISIHSLRMEGDMLTGGNTRTKSIISIHSLRMEGDITNGEYNTIRNISIHSLRMEGDDSMLCVVVL